MNKGKYAMTLVMLGIFVLMVGGALQFSEQARAMPLVIGIPGIVLCLLQFILDLREGKRSKASAQHDPRNEFEKAQATVSAIVGHKMAFDMTQETLSVVVDELPQGGERRRELLLWGSLVGFVAGILLFGFWLTIPVFLLLFLRLFAGKSWRFSLALAAVGTLLLYLVFGAGLGAILHPGFITDLLLEQIAER